MASSTETLMQAAEAFVGGASDDCWVGAGYQFRGNGEKTPLVVSDWKNISEEGVPTNHRETIVPVGVWLGRIAGACDVETTPDEIIKLSTYISTCLATDRKKDLERV